MGGLIVLVVLGVWGLICFIIVKFLLEKISNNIAKKVAAVILMGSLFVVPVSDEIIGGMQFRNICNDKLFLKVDESKVRGKTVVSTGIKSRIVYGALIKVTENIREFKDVESGEVVIGWNYFEAEGGFISRKLNLLQSRKPYTFSSLCMPENWKPSIFADLNVTKIHN